MCSPKLSANKVCQDLIESEVKEKTLTIIALGDIQLACFLEGVNEQSRIEDVEANSCLMEDLIDACSSQFANKVELYGKTLRANPALN